MEGTAPPPQPPASIKPCKLASKHMPYAHIFGNPSCENRVCKWEGLRIHFRKPIMRESCLQMGGRGGAAPAPTPPLLFDRASLPQRPYARICGNSSCENRVCKWGGLLDRVLQVASKAKLGSIAWLLVPCDGGLKQSDETRCYLDRGTQRSSQGIVPPRGTIARQFGLCAVRHHQLQFRCVPQQTQQQPLHCCQKCKVQRSRHAAAPARHSPCPEAD